MNVTPKRRLQKGWCFGATRRQFVLGAGCALAACANPAEEAGGVFEGYFQDLAAAMAQEAPEDALLLGLDPGKSHFTDFSPLGEEIRRTAILRRQVEAAGLRSAPAGPASRLTLMALQSRLTAMRALAEAPFGRLHSWGRFIPFALDPFDGGPSVVINALMRSAPLNLVEAAKHVEKLNEAGPAIDGEIARAAADAKVGFRAPDIALDETAQQIALWVNTPTDQSPALAGFNARYSVLAKENAAIAGQLRAAALRAVDRSLKPALARAYSIVQALRGAAPSRSLKPLYPAMASLALGENIAIEKALPKIQAEIDRLLAALDPPLRSLGLSEGSIGERLLARAFASDAAVPDAAALLSAAQSQRARLQKLAAAYVPEPKALELMIVAGAPKLGQAWDYISPPLAGAGRARLSLYPAPGFAMGDMAAAIASAAEPGRHSFAVNLHAAKDAPLVRRMQIVEGARHGWSLHALSIAQDLGAFRGPQELIGALALRLRAALRAEADLLLHAAEQPAELVFARWFGLAGLPAPAARFEAMRVLAQPGAALAAEMGRAFFAELYEKQRAARGARFDARTYHGRLLAGGELPLALYEGLL